MALTQLTHMCVFFTLVLAVTGLGVTVISRIAYQGRLGNGIGVNDVSFMGIFKNILILDIDVKENLLRSRSLLLVEVPKNINLAHGYYWTDWKHLIDRLSFL